MRKTLKNKLLNNLIPIGSILLIVGIALLFIFDDDRIDFVSGLLVGTGLSLFPMGLSKAKKLKKHKQ